MKARLLRLGSCVALRLGAGLPLWLGVTPLFLPAAAAQPAGIERDVHLGPAACAASVCHGKIAPQPGANVGLDEYQTWLKQDPHARAYRTLEQPASKRIAAKLGLRSATSAKICLDCHSDNVPPAKRGPRFQLTDGVGCEACHGGAEKWVDSHAAAAATHKDNVSRGMYPSEQPLPRAELCLSCHLGTKDRFATHLIMAAGHPRLSFELEAFTANQPAHYTVDADYRQRKGKIDGANLWLVGQLQAARTLLSLQRGERFRPEGGGLFPELAFYDCHACHHPMNQVAWTPERAGPGVRPGTLRLQTQNLAVLEAFFRSVDPGALAELGRLRNQLVLAGQKDHAAVQAAAGALIDWLRGREVLARRAYSRAEVVEIRRGLLALAASDTVGDYALAEQLVLGIESLSYAIGDRAGKKAALDRLFAAVKDRYAFAPAALVTAARGAQKSF